MGRAALPERATRAGAVEPSPGTVSVISSGTTAVFAATNVYACTTATGEPETARFSGRMAQTQRKCSASREKPTILGLDQWRNWNEQTAISTAVNECSGMTTEQSRAGRTCRFRASNEVFRCESPRRFLF
jgi:hypothetical protein